MTAHPHDDIEAFALGSLDDVSARRVLAHADQCPACAVLMADAMSTVESLQLQGERPLSKEIRFGDLAPVRGMSAGPSAHRPTWMLQVTAVAAVLLLIVWSFDLSRNLRANTLTVPVASLVHSHFSHHALHGPTGNAKVIQALDGRWLYLVADGLAPKTRYSLFETVGGAQHEVGDFTTTASGQATAYWEQSPARIRALQVVSSNAQSPVLRWP